jgi:hypothetical protein
MPDIHIAAGESYHHDSLILGLNGIVHSHLIDEFFSDELSTPSIHHYFVEGHRETEVDVDSQSFLVIVRDLLKRRRWKIADGDKQNLTEVFGCGEPQDCAIAKREHRHDHEELSHFS